MLPGLAPCVIPGGGWNLTSATYTGNSFDVSGEETTPYGPFFSPDGLNMYVAGIISDDVHQYVLSTAWDVSTASHYDSAALVADPRNVFFKPDGTKMYAAEGASGRIYEYDLSTGWDLNTLSYSGDSKDVGSQESTPTGLYFSPDGLKMFVTGSSSDDVFEYTLSTAWALSTASYSGVSFTPGTTAPYGLFFKPDGKVMYIVDVISEDIREYELSSEWDLSTASYSGASFTTSSQDTAPRGVFFKPDGKKMYVAGSVNDAVFEYDL